MTILNKMLRMLQEGHKIHVAHSMKHITDLSS